MVKNKKNNRVYFITVVSILSALAIIFVLIGGAPIFVMFPNLKVDLSDVPALIGSIIFSTNAGLLIELIKNLIHILKTNTLGIGELMALIVGSAIVISFSFPLKWLRKNFSLNSSFLCSYGFCIIFTSIIAILANSIVYPLFLLSVSSVVVTKSVMWTYLLAVLVVTFVRVSITVLISYLVIKSLKLLINQ